MSELSKENIASRLVECGVSEEMATDYAGLLDECEFARYAPSSDNSQMRSHYEKAAELISTIDSSMKTAKKKAPVALALVCFLTIGSGLNAAELPAEPASSGAQNPETYSENLWEKANQAYSEGRWEDAAADYSMIVSLGMESARLYYNLGNALYKSGSLCLSENCMPVGMSKLFRIWNACITAFSPVACLGAVAWKKAALTNRDGGVISPGMPCRPPPPPNAVSVRSPISRVYMGPAKRFV